MRLHSAPSNRNGNSKTILSVLVIALTVSVAVSAACAQTYTVIHDFGGSDGAAPASGLTIDAAGNLYGTTENGGFQNCSSGCGTVFKLANKNGRWVLTPLYNFQGGSDSAWPETRVVFGPNGTLYGTTAGGSGNSCSGDNGCGTVFNLHPQATFCASALCPWVKTTIYTFRGVPDGQIPAIGDLIFDRAGNIYGTTRAGGPENHGTVYKLTHGSGGWTESILYSFVGGNDGNSPTGVVFGQDGNLYGTTTQGGTVFQGYPGGGLIFELTPSGSGWSESVVYMFDQDDANGALPSAGLTIDTQGNLWGTAYAGGVGDCQSQDDAYVGCGTVFRWPPFGGGLLAIYGWPEHQLLPLSGPEGPVTFDSAGNVYGTTFALGANLQGNVFELSGGQYTYTSLHDLNGTTDGTAPMGAVVLDRNGNVYGTASSGGSSSACNLQGGCGTIWEITP
jgi:uncharacterized repeat protein (TIGR03803 family)